MEKSLEIVQRIFQGNHEFVDEHNEEYFTPFKHSQNPSIALLTCSDSRVQTNVFGFDSTNEIFVIRNIGNQIFSSFGSVDYAVYRLETPVLIIMGHSHCGAIKAVLSDYEDEEFEIIRELDHLSIPFRHHKNTKGQSEIEWLRITEQNVDYQVKLALKKYDELVEVGSLLILGIINDFANQYKQGEGRMIVINVNGTKNPEKNKNNPVFENFSSALKEQIFTRSKYHKKDII